MGSIALKQADYKNAIEYASSALNIARAKIQDMRIVSEEAAVMMVMGTARSMGVDIVEG